MNNRSHMRDVIISGFALFAIFFGAGNLIFPPMLGNISGDAWGAGVLGFLSTDPVLPILAVIATALVGGRAQDLGKRVSETFAIVLAAICILLIGPVLSVPRTAATTFEFAINPYIADSLSTPAMVATSVVFFGITLYFALNESKMIDVVGTFLTPSLLIVIGLLVIKAFLTPIGPIVSTGIENPYYIGFAEGYQTMDALGGALLCGVVLTDLTRKGYVERKEQRSMLVKVGIVAGILLAFVYAGLTYLGATTSANPYEDRVLLLLNSTQALFGNTGAVILGITVALACLTTAIGLTSTCGNFFNTVSNGRIGYKPVVWAAVIFSFFMSLLSVSGIIALAIPILSTVYPMVAVLVVMTLFDRYIPYDMMYTGPVLVAGVIGFFEAMYGSFAWFEGVHELFLNLPLAASGFPWLVPSIVALILFTIIGKMLGGKDSRPHDARA